MPRSKNSSESVRVRISADPATETFIINTRNQLKARGVGTFTTSQTPGTYKFKFRTGTHIDIKEVPISQTASNEISAPELGFCSPAALEGTSKTHEYHMENAELSSEHVHLQLGAGSQLFLFVRAWTENETAGSQQGHDPATGLTLHRIDGTPLADLAQVGVRQLADNFSSFDPWSACNIELYPGAYRLRLQTLEWGAIERVVIASPGWQTQVFLLQTSSEDEPYPSSFHLDLANGSLLLARIGEGFKRNNPAFRLCEIARGALEDYRYTLAKSLLKGSFDDKNPMLGIYCASALLTGNKPDRRLLSKTLKKLRHLLPSHPDVEAMTLALNDYQVGEPAFNFAAPPMLRSSWSFLIKKSIRKPDLIPYGSLSQQASTNLWGDGIWLTWLADRLATLPHDWIANSYNAAISYHAAIGAIFQAIRGLDIDEIYGYPRALLAGPLGLNNYEEALLLYLLRDQSERDVLIRGLGIPPAAIQFTAETLLMKLRGSGFDPLAGRSAPLLPKTPPDVLSVSGS